MIQKEMSAEGGRRRDRGRLVVARSKGWYLTA